MWVAECARRPEKGFQGKGIKISQVHSAFRVLASGCVRLHAQHLGYQRAQLCTAAEMQRQIKCSCDQWIRTPAAGTEQQTGRILTLYGVSRASL